MTFPALRYCVTFDANRLVATMLMTLLFPVAASAQTPPSVIVDSGGGIDTLTRSQGLTHADTLDVGVSGAGTIDFSGAAILRVDRSTDLGVEATGRGEIALSNNAVYQTNDLFVGLEGHGLLRVTDTAEANVTDDLAVGVFRDSSGEVFIDGAADVSSVNLAVGEEGIGELTLGGSANLTANSIVLGDFASGSGRVDINGGSATFRTASVGFEGRGVLNQTAGSLVVTDFFGLGEQQGSSGILNLSGGTTFFEADFFVGGARDGDGGEGVINISSRGDLSLDSELVVRSTGTINLSGGRLRVDEIDLQSGATLNLAGGRLETSRIDRRGEADFRFTGGALQAAEVNGDLTQEGGVLEPVGNDDFDGAMVIFGDYLQTAGALHTVIRGDTFGVDYHPVFVDGLAVLQGELQVEFAEGFRPEAGDQFEVIGSATELLGGFTEQSLPVLGGGLTLLTVAATDADVADGIAIRVAGVDGDYNYDGVVDAADFSVWRDSLGESGEGLGADGNGDGQITSDDYLVWQTNFGAIAATDFASVNATPEPSGAGVLLTLLSAGFARRKRRSGPRAVATAL